jgi:hypothetical protein
MIFKRLFNLLLFISAIYLVSANGAGCAQIGAPTGGTKDTLAPKLVKALPDEKTIHFKGNKISLTFDEYVEVQDVQKNVLVSPLTKNNPQIDSKLKTITIKFKDSLLPNTTYAINFGNAIKDVNEGNPFTGFTYVFSTGNSIDTLSLSGKLLMAETGKVDSSLVAMLYRNTSDTAVQKLKPDYMAFVKGDGSFTFNNLPAGNFNLFALKDTDGSKTYNSKKEAFAFNEKPISIDKINSTFALMAYAEEKEKPAPPAVAKVEKKLKYSSNLFSARQDLLSNLELSFNNPLMIFKPAEIILTDTNYKPINAIISVDSTSKIISLKTIWTEDFNYRLLINKDAVADSAANRLAKNDTLRFTTKKESEYGNLIIRFNNIDLTKKPLLQFIQADEIKESYPLSSKEWNKKLFEPGEYELRILYDENGNGKWDAGSYQKKKQPEKVTAIPQKISVRNNFDNEKEISLAPIP